MDESLLVTRPTKAQRFLKFTGQQMKFKMIDEKNKILNEFLVEAKDRAYQIWERNSLSIDLWTEKFSFKNWITSIIILVNIYGIWQNILKNINTHQQSFIKQELMILVFYHIIVDESLLVTRPTKAWASANWLSLFKLYLYTL